MRIFINNICYWLLLMLVFGPLASCRTPGGKKKDEKAQSGKVNGGAMLIPIGTVHLVNEAGKFVLIRSSRALKIEPGTVIDIIGPGGAPVASAQVSPARRGQFLTADIITGVPSTGNQVLMNYEAKEPANASAPSVLPGSDIQILE